MTSRASRLILPFFGAVQLVAITGDRLKQFCLVGMLGLLAPGSSIELLKLNLFSQVPMLLFTPVFGALLDRWNKPAAIVSACIVRALIVACVPFFFGVWPSLYAIYIAAFVLSIADLVFAPARSALLPAVVSAPQLLQANAVFWALGIVGALAGFLGGGWLFDFRSWQSGFHADSLVYVLAAALMLPVLFLHRDSAATTDPRPARGREGLRQMGRAIAEGARLIQKDRHIAICLISQCVLFAIGGVLSIIAVARVQEVAVDGRAFVLGVVAASLIVGLMVGSGIAGLFRERASLQRAISVGALLAGVAITGLGRTEGVTPLCIWAGLFGVSISPVFVITETMIQHHSPREFLGRVFTSREALIKAAYLAAAIAATVANAFFSKTTILTALGLFLALSGVILERASWLRTERE